MVCICWDCYFSLVSRGHWNHAALFCLGKTATGLHTSPFSGASTLHLSIGQLPGSQQSNPCGAFTRCNSSERTPISSRLRFSSCSTSSSSFRCSETLIPVASPRHILLVQWGRQCWEKCAWDRLDTKSRMVASQATSLSLLACDETGNIPDLRISINPQNHHPTKLEISEPKNGFHREIIDKNGGKSMRILYLLAENPAKILRNPRKSSQTPNLRVESSATSWANSCNSRRFWLSSWRGECKWLGLREHFLFPIIAD